MTAVACPRTGAFADLDQAHRNSLEEAAMARKRKTARKAPAAPPARGTSDRDKAIDALMALLTEHSFEDIGLAEIAGRAGLKLSQLRAEFGSTLAIFGAHIKDIDRAVLDGGDEDMAQEPPRDRLFDVLMRRLEAMEPYKEAVRSMLRSARRNAGLALALNAMAVRSQAWMLEAAGIGASGPRGALRAQGAALMFARVVGVWLDDDEDGTDRANDRAMAALNRGLASAERWDGFVGDLCAIPQCVLRGRGRWRRRRHRGEDEEAQAA
jgi:AcrR family transcriptional regulator